MSPSELIKYQVSILMFIIIAKDFELLGAQTITCANSRVHAHFGAYLQRLAVYGNR